MSKIIRLINWYIFYLDSISLMWGIATIVLGVLLIGIMYWMYHKRKIEPKSAFALWFTIEYCFMILASTVFSRVRADAYRYNLNPLEVIYKLFDGNIDDRYEVYLNILLLLPIGFLLSRICKKYKIILIGIFMSLTIEFLQLLLMCGTFETGDIILNIFGVFLGIALYKRAIPFIKNTLWKKIKNRYF